MNDHDYMERAITLALESEREGNLPIGSLFVLDDEIIGEGKSTVLLPDYNPGRHAEINAIRSIDPMHWPRAAAMTCYTTLEPCVMCYSTMLLHGVGRIVFGAYDVKGGARFILKNLPPYYANGGVPNFEGPLMPGECDPLYLRADATFSGLPCGQSQAP